MSKSLVFYRYPGGYSGRSGKVQIHPNNDWKTKATDLSILALPGEPLEKMCFEKQCLNMT